LASNDGWNPKFYYEELINENIKNTIKLNITHSFVIDKKEIKRVIKKLNQSFDKL